MCLVTHRQLVLNFLNHLLRTDVHRSKHIPRPSDEEQEALYPGHMHESQLLKYSTRVQQPEANPFP